MLATDLKLFLNYNPLDGTLWWKPRPAWMFRSVGSWKSWNSKYSGKRALTAPNSNGYLHGTICYRTYFAHRVVWAICNGEWPDCIDHINGSRDDNRLINLRSVSVTENNRNQMKPERNTSGCVGVYWEGRQSLWLAKINHEGNPIHIGYFRDKEDAIAARKAAEQSFGYHPNHGRTEFVAV